MATAIKEIVHQFFGLTPKENIILSLTQDEANYLAALTRDYPVDVTKVYSDRSIVPEPTQHTIHRQRIFTALAGVTQS